MASTLDQVYRSLGSVYDPIASQYQQRQAAIPGQIAEEEKGLSAKQENAFGEILGGARRRGMGFSGIPLQEQAKYTASEFLPALARLKQTGREQAMSLEEAILGLQRDRRTQAQGIYEANRNYSLAERQFKEGQRQFNAQMKAQAEANRQAAAAARSAAAGFSPSFGGSSTLGTSGPKADKNAEVKNQAMAGVQGMLQRRNDPSFYREVLAINQSAGYGNPIDKAKLELLRALQPGLFVKNKLNTARVNTLLSGGAKPAGGGW